MAWQQLPASEWPPFSQGQQIHQGNHDVFSRRGLASILCVQCFSMFAQVMGFWSVCVYIRGRSHLLHRLLRSLLVVW